MGYERPEERFFAEACTRLGLGRLTRRPQFISSRSADQRIAVKDAVYLVATEVGEFIFVDHGVRTGRKNLEERLRARFAMQQTFRDRGVAIVRPASLTDEPFVLVKGVSDELGRSQQQARIASAQELLELDSCDPSKFTSVRELLQYASQVGSVAAGFHKITIEERRNHNVPLKDPDAPLSEKEWVPGFTWDYVIARAESLNVSIRALERMRRLTPFANRCIEAADPTRDDSVVSLCHGDLQPDNLGRDKEGHIRMLDLDTWGFDPPSRDLRRFGDPIRNAQTALGQAVRRLGVRPARFERAMMNAYVSGMTDDRTMPFVATAAAGYYFTRFQDIYKLVQYGVPSADQESQLTQALTEAEAAEPHFSSAMQSVELSAVDSARPHTSDMLR